MNRQRVPFFVQGGWSDESDKTAIEFDHLTTDLFSSWHERSSLPPGVVTKLRHHDPVFFVGRIESEDVGFVSDILELVLLKDVLLSLPIRISGRIEINVRRIETDDGIRFAAREAKDHSLDFSLGIQPERRGTRTVIGTITFDLPRVFKRVVFEAQEVVFFHEMPVFVIGIADTINSGNGIREIPGSIAVVVILQFEISPVDIVVEILPGGACESDHAAIPFHVEERRNPVRFHVMIQKIA